MCTPNPRGSRASENFGCAAQLRTPGCRLLRPENCCPGFQTRALAGLLLRKERTLLMNFDPPAGTSRTAEQIQRSAKATEIRLRKIKDAQNRAARGQCIGDSVILLWRNLRYDRESL